MPRDEPQAPGTIILLSLHSPSLTTPSLLPLIFPFSPHSPSPPSLFPNSPFHHKCFSPLSLSSTTEEAVPVVRWKRPVMPAEDPQPTTGIHDNLLALCLLISLFVCRRDCASCKMEETSNARRGRSANCWYITTCVNAVSVS